MLFELLSRRAELQPKRVALVCGDRTFTWEELYERASRMAAHGVSAESKVALALGNGEAFVTGLLALSRIGAQVLLLSPELKTPELQAAMAGAGCETLLTAGSLAAAYQPAPLSPRAAATEPFLHLLTSGTTGKPRRIIRSQQALVSLAASYCATARISAEDRILGVIPLHHGHGLCNAFLAPLYSGATLILEPAFDRRKTLRLLNEEAITVLSAPPFVFSILADSLQREPFACPKLRLGLSAGAPLTRQTWERVRDRLGIRLRQVYGASETGVVAMNMDDDPEPAAESVGRPISGVEVKVLDEGDIAVRSPGAAGWWAPLDSKEVFTLAGDDGWVQMADTGRFDADGRLYVTGRKSRFLNIAGRRVNQLEVEEVLLQHPSVTEASITSLPDERGNDIAHAVVYCRDARTPEELVEFCRERLASYKIPRSIEVRLDGARSK